MAILTACAVGLWIAFLAYSIVFAREVVPPKSARIREWGTETVFRPILFPEYYRGEIGPYNPYGFQKLTRKPIGYDDGN